MHAFKKISLAAAALAALAAPTSALAANATATGTLSGSAFSISTAAAPTFSANLDAGDSTPTFTVPVTTQDTRGTGAGWNETITSTQYTTGGSTPQVLAGNASSLTAVTSANGPGTSTSPTNAVTYPVAVPAAATAPTAVKFFNSAASTGMGRFAITSTIGVAVPQNSFAGSYTSTLTLSIVTGP